MTKKQLIVVVEGTGAVGPFWKTITSDYLEKIIRSFAEGDSIEQNPSAGDVELSLVMFNVHDSYSACMLQRSGWTRDIDLFFQWLSALPFSGGGFNDVAAAEGLAEALMMFCSLNGSQQTQQNADGQRHCILVAASNPYPLPRPVHYPAMLNLEQSENIETHTSLRLADAETVARVFPQCSVSLSVICPRKLPKLRAVYNAGKRDRQAADPPVDTSKNPNFLVLISENFSEACAAFSHTEMESLLPNQILVEMNMSSVPPVSGPPATSNPSVMNQQPISAGNIPATTVNIESAMVTSVSGPAPAHILTVHPTSQVAASLQSGSLISVSEEMVPNNENIKETTPIISVRTQSLRPFGGAAANVGILNGVASAIIIRGNLPGTQMMPSWIGMHQNVPSGMGTGMPLEIDTMIPPPGMTQQGQPEILPFGRNNSAEANMSLSQQQTLATSPSAQSGYVKIWEGNLSMVQDGNPVHITRLQGYKRSSASESLAANLPQTLRILYFTPKDLMFEIVRQCTGKTDILTFWAIDGREVINYLQESNLSGVISLPSRTLFVYISDISRRLVGLLLPYENMKFVPTIPNQQLQPPPLPGVQQLQAQPITEADSDNQE